MAAEQIAALVQAARDMSSCDPGSGRSYGARPTCADTHPTDPSRWCAGCVLAALTNVPDCSACGQWSGGQPLCATCLASPAPHGDAGLRELAMRWIRESSGGYPGDSTRSACAREVLALLDAPPTAAQAEAIRREAAAIVAHEPVTFAECTVAEDVMARARRILELLK